MNGSPLGPRSPEAAATRAAIVEALAELLLDELEREEREDALAAARNGTEPVV